MITTTAERGAVTKAMDRMKSAVMLLAPDYKDAAIADLLQLAAAPTMEPPRTLAEVQADITASYGAAPAVEAKPFPMVNNWAVIPVQGMLINRCNYSWGFLTGYGYIRSMALAAAQDPDVEGVLFDFNSPGGEAAGVPELVADLLAAKERSGKPFVGIIDSMCYSACYWIASTMDTLYCTPSGGAGSIGSLYVHMDLSGYYEKLGVTVTVLTSGENKADGSAMQPLTKSAKARLQAQLDAIRGTFAANVAQNRSLPVETVMGTEAKCFTASEALELGLVDSVASPMDAVTSTLTGVNAMSQTTASAAAPAAAAPAQAAPAAASVVETAVAAAPAAAPVAAAASASSERERIKAITTCEAAKGREALANHLAFSTELSAQDAAGILAAAPLAQVAEAAAPAAPAAVVQPVGSAPTGFEAAMVATGNPGISAAVGEADEKANQTNALLGALTAATGRKFD